MVKSSDFHPVGPGSIRGVDVFQEFSKSPRFSKFCEKTWNQQLLFYNSWCGWENLIQTPFLLSVLQLNPKLHLLMTCPESFPSKLHFVVVWNRTNYLKSTYWPNVFHSFVYTISVQAAFNRLLIGLRFDIPWNGKSRRGRNCCSQRRTFVSILAMYI